jgi:peptide/nickel transport system ATP-binding protein
MKEQRVAIARAFAGDPRFVILGKSTAALDLPMQATILNSLNDRQAGRRTAYLFISRDLTIVRYMADRVGLLYRGQFCRDRSGRSGLRCRLSSPARDRCC